MEGLDWLPHQVDHNCSSCLVGVRRKEGENGQDGRSTLHVRCPEQPWQAPTESQTKIAADVCHGKATGEKGQGLRMVALLKFFPIQERLLFHF